MYLVNEAYSVERQSFLYGYNNSLPPEWEEFQSPMLALACGNNQHGATKNGHVAKNPIYLTDAMDEVQKLLWKADIAFPVDMRVMQQNEIRSGEKRDDQKYLSNWILFYIVEFK